MNWKNRKKAGMNLKDFELLIDNHQSTLINHAYWILGTRTDAEDIVQDSFVKFYHRLPNISDQSKAKSYLFQIVHNASIDFIRSIKVRKTIPLSNYNLSDQQVTVTDKTHNQQIETNNILTLLHELPVEQADIIIMRIYDNLSFVEISNILKIPESTVKSRFKYGIDKLKKTIGNYKEVYYEM